MCCEPPRAPIPPVGKHWYSITKLEPNCISLCQWSKMSQVTNTFLTFFLSKASRVACFLPGDSAEHGGFLVCTMSEVKHSLLYGTSWVLISKPSLSFYLCVIEISLLTEKNKTKKRQKRNVKRVLCNGLCFSFTRCLLWRSELWTLEDKGSTFVCFFALVSQSRW